MPVFEASESIVSTFPALILVLILVVLDSVSPSMKSHLTHHQHMNQSSSNFGFSAENPAAVSPIDLIDHPVEVVAKSVGQESQKASSLFYQPLFCPQKQERI